MTDFKRARSEEQKSQRMSDIKQTALAQFAVRSYHEITLTTISEDLGWSRAALYKYVSTKEEIFLDLMADTQDSYFSALLAAFPPGCNYSLETAATVWAGIINVHQDWLRLGDLLSTIVETNVSVAKLIEFKRRYYTSLEKFKTCMQDSIGLSPQRAEDLHCSIYYHGKGVVCSCWANPLLAQALEALGKKQKEMDFRAEMETFILMNLRRYCA